MTRILLEISRDKDLELLLALLKRLEIRVVQTETNQPQPALSDEDRAIILKGLPERADFEAFLLDFQQNREDRPLPDR